MNWSRLLAGTRIWGPVLVIVAVLARRERKEAGNVAEAAG
ncbi:MAG: hypothetical protein K0Q96_210 [Rubrobacteraceae bacterium]|jgi:hypothetical protein|nr:hypothetical protein [Rubrobacteraceae bacterium]